ncbi:hypothetical protein D6C97_03495 [Aureobasidium pullulans]|nr:hypothetical protein D6C97_03495 [Aureobasidium pullulans]
MFAGGDKEQDGDRIESLKMSSGDGGFLVVTDGIVVGPEGHCWSDLHMDVYESTDWALCEFGGQEQLGRCGTGMEGSRTRMRVLDGEAVAHRRVSHRSGLRGGCFRGVFIGPRVSRRVLARQTHG